MNFEDLLRRAKEGEAEAIRQIHWMYRPLLIKNAMELGIFDEDLYQELCAALLQCIRMFTYKKFFVDKL